MFLPLNLGRTWIRYESPCHTCQHILNVLIVSDFLWQVRPKMLVISCHKGAWQAMTRKNSFTCHRKSLTMIWLTYQWQVWQGFLYLDFFDREGMDTSWRNLKTRRQKNNSPRRIWKTSRSFLKTLRRLDWNVEAFWLKCRSDPIFEFWFKREYM